MIVLITPHAYTHHCISLDLTCRLTCLYIILIIFEHDICIIIHLIVIAYMWTRVAYFVPCLIACHMIALLCVIACCLFVWDAHLSPYLSPSSLGHFLHYGSHFCKCETLCVLVLWPRERLRVGSSDGLYRCLGAFWRRAAHCCRLESDHWRLV